MPILNGKAIFRRKRRPQRVRPRFFLSVAAPAPAGALNYYMGGMANAKRIKRGLGF